MKTKTPPSPTSSDWFRHLRLALAVLAILGLLSVVAYAVWRFRPGPERFQISFHAIEVSPSPEHLSAKFLAEVQSLGSLPDQLDTREPDLAARLGFAFSSHPWVQKVEVIAIEPGPRIRARLTFRAPVAVVVIQRDRYLIDANAVLLGPKRELTDLLEIRGITSVPGAAPGQPWGSPLVERAAQLAALLQADRASLKLAAIEVGNDPLAPDLRLRTEAGTQILWQQLGQADPSHPPEEKLRQLRQYRQQHGSLDDPPGTYQLDVRQPGEIRRRMH